MPEAETFEFTTLQCVILPNIRFLPILFLALGNKSIGFKKKYCVIIMVLQKAWAFSITTPVVLRKWSNDRQQHHFRSIVHLKLKRHKEVWLIKGLLLIFFKSSRFAKKGNGYSGLPALLSSVCCHAQWKNRAVQRMPKSLHDNFIECYSRFKTAPRSTIENSWLLIQMGINIVQYPFMKSAIMAKLES